MSIGNLKTNGNKGNNFPYQLANLELLGQILTAIPAAACCPTAATEATLLSVLVALQNGQEFEQNIVTDLGGAGCPASCPVYLQIRIFNSGTGTFDPPIYYDADGNLVVPVGPLQFNNTQYVLDNILLQVTAINSELSFSAHSGFTPTVSSSGVGTVAVGAYSVVIHNTGGAIGIANGAPIAAGASRTYTAAFKKTLPAIGFDATGTTFYIEKLNY